MSNVQIMDEVYEPAVEYLMALRYGDVTLVELINEADIDLKDEILEKLAANPQLDVSVYLDVYHGSPARRTNSIDSLYISGVEDMDGNVLSHDTSYFLILDVEGLLAA